MAVGTGTAILGGSLVSGLMGGSASRSQARAADAAADEQRRQFDLIRGDTAPYRQAGVGALSRYNQLMGLPTNNVLAAPQQPQTTQPQYGQPGQPLFPGYLPGETHDTWNERYRPAPNNTDPSTVSTGGIVQNMQPQDPGQPAGESWAYGNALPEFSFQTPEFNYNMEADPGYQFARDEAIKAATRGAARQGYRNSGNVLAEIGDRVTGVASQYANDIFNRQLGTYNTRTGRELQQHGLNYQRGQDMYGRNQDYLNRLGSIAGIGQSAVTQSGNAGMQMAGNVGNALMAQGQANADRYGSWNNAIQGGISNYLLYDQLGRR